MMICRCPKGLDTLSFIPWSSSVLTDLSAHLCAISVVIICCCTSVMYHRCRAATQKPTEDFETLVPLSGLRHLHSVFVSILEQMAFLFLPALSSTLLVGSICFFSQPPVNSLSGLWGWGRASRGKCSSGSKAPSHIHFPNTACLCLSREAHRDRFNTAKINKPVPSLWLVVTARNSSQPI